MDEDKAYFLDGIDEKNVTTEIWRSLNTLYSRISHLINYKYHLIIYRLVKKDYVDIKNLEDATGYSKQRIYQIVNEFERREVERTNTPHETKTS